MPRRASLLFAVLCAYTISVSHAQVSVRAEPYSFRTLLATEVPTYTVSPDRLMTAAQPSVVADAYDFGLLPAARVGAELDVDLGFDNAGTWQLLPDGGRLWRLRIAARGAASLHLIYDDFWMPPGARFFVYNDDRSIVRGAFTERNNKAHGGFATDFVPGEALTLEYVEPAGVPAGRLHVARVVHGSSSGAADGLTTANSPYTPASLSCSINVACSEGNGWQDAINATVRISNGCTGVLLNNTREDETPYVLTANHCNTPAVGDTLNWVFQFNYESSTCADPAETPTYQSVQGAVVRAAEGGLLDYTLLELLEPIPGSYNVHYAGWSISTAQPTRGVVIGHPGGDIKKITLDDDQVQHYGAYYWRAIFDHGTIEEGSSGSPLFNENHQVVGHIRGSLGLDPNTCSGPGGDDNDPEIYFPKLYYIWNNGTPGQRLSDFLDPDGTGASNIPALGPQSPIWINEVNAHGSGAQQDDEFVEIVGPPGTSLTGYKLDVYTCSGGTATLASVETFGSFTLQNDYNEFGIFLLAGPSATLSNVDQTFDGAGTDTLPDGHGILVLRDASGDEIFDYQYDTETGGVPDHCPSGYTTRSPADGVGVSSMGFTINSRPTPTDIATNGLTATPGEQNWDGGQTLPVELVGFDAVLDGNAVLLRWKTASETNNAGFEVQMIGPGSPGAAEDWRVLGWMDGHGTTLEQQVYDFRADGLLAGTHRFRLKQVDYDGTFEYSPEVEVAVGLPTAYALSQAYPNPFNPTTQFSLSVAQRQRVEVSVYNLLGRRVALLHDGDLDAASTRAFTFDAGTLPSGLYLIRAVGERFAASQTITLVK